MPVRALVAFALLAPLAAHAVTSADVLRLSPAGAEDLPELPGNATASGWTSTISDGGAGLQYRNAREKWSGRVGVGADSVSLIRLAHARRLSDKFGAGTALVQDAGSEEVLLNALYAHKPNLRLRFSAAQRRSTSDGEASTEYASYLFGVDKSWRKAVWADAGVTWHTAQTSSRVTSSAHDDPFLQQALDLQDEGADTSRTHSLTLNLALRPLPGSRLELEHQAYSTSQRLADGTSDGSDGRYSRISITQQFRSCVAVLGAFRHADNNADLELSIGNGNWFLRAWQALGGERAASVQVGYSIPLGGRAARETCNQDNYQRPRESMVDLLTAAPAEFSS